MNPAISQRLRLSDDTELSFITADDPSMPAILLLHGFPGSVRTFREVVPELSQAAYVIAPDLPGFGESDVLPAVSFPALRMRPSIIFRKCRAYIKAPDAKYGWYAPASIHCLNDA